jgi:general secretion pathway protein C
VNFIRRATQKLKPQGKGSPSFALDRFYPYLLMGVSAYMLADLLILLTRPALLPQGPLPEKPVQSLQLQVGPLSSYSSIASRNIFSSKGIIPPALESEESKEVQELPPIPSQLPLELIGTLVHSNPAKSLAAIQLKNKNETLSFSVGTDVDNMARVENIQRQLVFLRNLNTQRLEYIEIKSTSKINFDSAKPSLSSGKQDVKKLGENKFVIKKSDLLKYTSDLSSVLMQARAVPARRAGTGEVYGWKLADIQPNSIFTQLGLQPGDTILNVNGRAVTSVQEAMAMYQEFQNASQIMLEVERPNGTKSTMEYNVQ